MRSGIEQAVAAYYLGKFKQGGATPQGVDWNSAESQRLRFAQLERLLPEDEADFSVLDFGCGWGALYPYLEQRRRRFSYTGVELVAEMLAEAEARYGGGRARWCLSLPDDFRSDYTLASGVFNVRLSRSDGEWLDYVRQTLRLFDRVSRKGFAFNILTKYSDPERTRDDLYYADPCVLFDFCRQNFSRRVALLHDYPLYEFTLMVRKA